MNVASKMSKMIEDTISEALIKAVQNLSVEIDEKELLKRMRDSKEQYQRGYEAREHELVRCKDCKHRTKRICNNIEFWECNHIRYGLTKCGVTDDWFCADGERKNAE